MVAQVTLQQVAQELVDAFEWKSRDNGTQFVIMKDVISDSWVKDAVYIAHDDALPNDSIYAMVYAVSEQIADLLNEIPESNQDADEPLDIHERIDSIVPVYTHELKQWLLDNPNADAAIENAIANCYVDLKSDDFDLSKLLMAGYYTQLDEIASTLWDAIAARYNALQGAEPEQN